jgi:hypothetical protein
MLLSLLLAGGLGLGFLFLSILLDFWEEGNYTIALKALLND